MHLKTGRKLIAAIASLGSIACADAAYAQGCPREGLQEIADQYVTAQTNGSPFSLPVGEWLDYYENEERSAAGAGIISQPLNVAWHLDLIDTRQCRVFVEAVTLDPKEYVIAVRLDKGYFGVGPIRTIVTDEGDWLFNAKKTYEYASKEDWGIIPEDKRNTREEILAAANAYLDRFNDASVVVPWGTPCARLEGGLYTGKGEPTDSCDVGVPEGIDMADRQYIVDEAKGAVAVFLRFGGEEGLPDVHTFRVEEGKIRYVHTVTNCGDQENCGFPPMDEVPQ